MRRNNSIVAVLPPICNRNKKWTQSQRLLSKIDLDLFWSIVHVFLNSQIKIRQRAASVIAVKTLANRRIETDSHHKKKVTLIHSSNINRRNMPLLDQIARCIDAGWDV